jgi:hypothetical protein
MLMASERLFVATFVVVHEQRWCKKPDLLELERTEKNYHLESRLYAAGDSEQAYEIATRWIPGFKDSNYDGPSDENRYYSIGIYDIDELTSTPQTLERKVHELYGVDGGNISCKDISPAGVPQVKSKNELSIYRWPHVRDT